jgi:hypothetical protein
MMRTMVILMVTVTVMEMMMVRIVKVMSIEIQGHEGDEAGVEDDRRDSLLPPTMIPGHILGHGYG